MESCPVCLESIEGKNIFTTKCGHKFCANCILNNSNYAETCPICRTNLDLQINLEPRPDNDTNATNVTNDNRDRFYNNNNRIMRVLNVEKTIDYLHRQVSIISREAHYNFFYRLKELFDNELDENENKLEPKTRERLERNICQTVNGNLLHSCYDFIHEVNTHLNSEITKLEISGRINAIDDILNNLDNN